MKFLEEDDGSLSDLEVEILNVGIAFQEAIRSVYAEIGYLSFKSKDPRKSKNWTHATEIQKKLKSKGIDPYTFARIVVEKWKEVTGGKFCSISLLKSNKALGWYYDYRQEHKFSTSSSVTVNPNYAVSVVSKKLGISAEEARKLLGGKAYHD